MVISKFIEENECQKVDVLAVLGIDEYKFLQIITDTRNWYSHMWKSKDKDSRLSDGKLMVIYFEIIYYAIRLYLISNILMISVQIDFVKEYLYILHDWIVEVYLLDIDFKSNTYLIYKSKKMIEQKINR